MYQHTYAADMVSMRMRHEHDDLVRLAASKGINASVAQLMESRGRTVKQHERAAGCEECAVIVRMERRASA